MISTIKDIIHPDRYCIVMKRVALILLVMCIAAMALPAMAAEDDKYSYITVREVEINVEDEQAIVNIDYSLDEGIRLLVMLLGKNDLKNKILKIVNYDGARIEDITLERAVVVVDNAAQNYGDGSYWLPEHTFSVTVPTLRVSTPQTVRHFNMTKEFPRGIGFFRI
jgi:hypothetical protein